LNGFFSCAGDPGIQVTTPVLDWMPFSSSCRLNNQGEGTLMFYAHLRPKTVPPSRYNLFLTSETGFVSGQLSGQIPSCQGCGATSTEKSSWGSIKAVYK
jgi:hypothetical protein